MKKQAMNMAVAFTLISRFMKTKATRNALVFYMKNKFGDRVHERASEIL